MLTMCGYNFIGVAFLRSYGGHSWWILVAFTVCYSPFSLTSDCLLSDLMWFLCRSWHNRYVEFGSFRKVIGFSNSHVYICDNKGSEIFTAA